MSSDKNNNEKPRIKVNKNGPYTVSGSAQLSEQIIGVDSEGQSHGWKQDKGYETGEHYALCRCGGSKNKPFCDGSHLKNGFNGTETAPIDALTHRIEGPGLDMVDAESLFASARFCDRAGGISYLIETSDDKESRQTAIEEACDCPSGRLTACDKEGHAIEPKFKPSIGAVEDTQMGCNGPLWLRGGIPVESADGATYKVRNRTTLCRCGKS